MTFKKSIILSWVLSFFVSKINPMIYGVSFSPEYAGYLKLDPQKVFDTILNEWKFKYIRLSAQWNKLEKKQGEFDFSELDWQMDGATKSGAHVVMALGQKTPRWPECHLPEWVNNLSDEDYRLALENYMAKVVGRYKNNPALEIWQVENEPFLAFGKNCPKFNIGLLSEEIALVKALDSFHPTLVSDSGELSTWRKTANVADLFGTTMYRVVWSKYIGYWSYRFLPPIFYRLKLFLNSRPIEQAFVMELQGEPWIPDKDIFDVPLEEQYKSMSLERLKKNVTYAAKVGMPRGYLWGAEWWFWLKERGVKDIPDFVTTLSK